MRFIYPLLFSIAVPCAAQDAPLSLTCNGTAPDWSLTMTADSAMLSYGYDIDLTVALETRALGGDWPRAFSMLGRGSSAILLLEPETCGEKLMSARVLTQRGETPILLAGCCSELN